MANFKLDYVKNIQFEYKQNNLGMKCDQPAGDGGGDGEFLSPVSYFVSSIAMCAGTYAGFFYKKAEIDMKGFYIDGNYEVEYSRDAKIKSISMKIYCPNIVEKKDKKKLENIVNRCLIVNTVKDVMDVTKEFIYI